MKEIRLFILPRLTALFLSLCLVLPAPSYGLRPMSGEGAGVEEIRLRLIPTIQKAGLEERGTRILVGREISPWMLGDKLKEMAQEVSREIGAQLEKAPELQAPSRLRVVRGVPHLENGPLIGFKENLDLFEQATPDQANILRLSVLNLYEAIQNAVDAIADRAEDENKRFSGKIEVVVRRDQDALVLEIIDNGIGIPEVFSGWILRESFTTKEEGTRAGGEGKGLGLYASQLLKETRGVLEWETLRLDNSKEEEKEKSWRLVYDPSKNDSSRYQVSQGNRVEPGTTVRWRFPGVFPQGALTQAGLEEPVPYDEAVRVDESSYTTFPNIIPFPGARGLQAGFLPIPASGVLVPKAYLKEWGQQGFLVLNQASAGRRILKISTPRGSQFPQVMTTFYQEGAGPRRKRLDGRSTSGAGSIRTEDAIFIQVTAQGVFIRPEGSAQIYMQRMMTPFERRLETLYGQSEQATQQRLWSTLRSILAQTDRMRQKVPRVQQSPFARRLFDLLEIGRINLFMYRRMPSPWFAGDPIPVSFEDDLWKALTVGQAFLQQSPAPSEENRKVVRTAQAHSIVYLSAGGRLTERSQVERLLTDPEIPRGNVFELLYTRWVNRAIEEQTRQGGTLDPADDTYVRMLAYALLNADETEPIFGSKSV